MPIEHIRSCACTGVRTCLLCHPESNESNLNSGSFFHCWYCPECKQKWQGDISLADKAHNDGWCQLHKDQQPLPHIVDGIFVFEDFINGDEELFLLKEIDKDPWKLSQSGRRKQDFGPKVNFKKQKLKLGTFTGLPSYSEFLVKRMNDVHLLEKFKPVELCNLEYIPERGSSIDPHIDDMWLWGDQLVTVNLKSSTLLTLTAGAGNHKLKMSSYPEGKLTNVEIQIPMPARSLFVLQSEARTLWLHGIKADHIRDKRLAMTFRNLSRGFESDEKYTDIRQELDIVTKNFHGTVVT